MKVRPNRAIGIARRARKEWWYAPHRAIVAVGVLLISLAVFAGTLGVIKSTQAEQSGAQSARYLALEPPVRAISQSVADFQVVAVGVFDGSTPATSALNSAARDSDAFTAAYSRLATLLVLPGNAALAPHLSAQIAAYKAANAKFGLFLTTSQSPAQATSGITAEQTASATFEADLVTLQAAITDRATYLTEQAQKEARSAREGLLWSLVIGGSFGIVVTALFAAKAWRRDATQVAVTRRTEFEGRLQRGLEMTKAEGPVFDLVAEALATAAPNLHSELLLADSSHAHFRQVLANASRFDEGGCGVVSPDDCPAATGGQAMSFLSSTAMDACPHLKGRGCSALCVPVSISGNSVGVFHVTAPEGSAPASTVRQDVEVVARRASERLAMLRAFELSQTQANTDSLTGLLTRRSLESGVREIETSGVQYSVAYGDLDHFKLLNDTFGHDAGDRALRTFSQVLRDSLRPADIPSRYGGEEFVIVLPACAIAEAVLVLERVMQRTAQRLVAGDHPTFTVSFGLASSEQASDFHQVVALADAALLRAKAGGRNEIVIADSVRSAHPGGNGGTTSDGGGAPMDGAAPRSAVEVAALSIGPDLN